MVSKTCEYAIRAVLFVAQQSQKDIKVSVKEIALAIDSPEAFIAKILQNLRRKGILFSAKGPTGGFYLNNKGLKYSLADVINAIDGDKLFTSCGLGLTSCSAKKPCPIHDEFAGMRKQMKVMMESAILGDYKAALDTGERYLKR